MACRRTARWITSQLDLFSLGGRPALDPPRLKAFGELTIAYSCLKRWGVDDVLKERQALENWKNLICRDLSTDNFFDTARRNPGQLAYFLLPYLALRAHGLTNPRGESLLLWNLREGHMFRGEKTPYRSLELEYLLWHSGVTTQEPNWKALGHRTVLGMAPSPIALDVPDAYAITHSIFYLTDWGTRRLPLGRSATHELVDVLMLALVHFWRLGHHDLVGEILISLEFLRAPGNRIQGDIAQGFVRLSSPTGCVAALRTQSPQDVGDRISTFRTCYHTTLVQLLYCGYLAGNALGTARHRDRS